MKQQSILSPHLDPEPYRHAAEAIKKLAPSVKHNLPEFASFSLSADYLAHVTWREQQWWGEPNFAEIARHDIEILKVLEAEWSVARFDDGAGKTEPYGLSPLTTSSAPNAPGDRLLKSKSHGITRPGSHQRSSP